MNQWKSAHAAKTDARTLAEALDGADIVFGLSAKGALTAGDDPVDGARTRSSSPWPIPIRRSRPEEVAEIRTDAIMATGRSDYPNQVNNVLGFPYIFRGALDVRATTINDEMKVAAARALAALARAGRARRRRRRLSGQPPEIRPQLHHPGAVRPAPDLGHPGRRRQGGDGFRRRAQADPRPRPICATNCRPAATRSPRRCSASTTACAASPSASSSPRARRSR